MDGSAKDDTTNDEKLDAWQKRRIGDHIFAVIRHAERADGAFAFCGGQRWTQSDDFVKFPHDPPLSDEGFSSARTIALRCRGFAEECGTKVNVVVTSPFARCVQTAVVIRQVLGPGTRMLIDRGIGEIFGPNVMGPVEPTCATRPLEQIPKNNLKRSAFIAKTVGESPKWPEDTKSARQRFATRFLTYLQRSMTTKRNFILVTHADCVGAALSMMPSHAGQVAEKIDYCGMFLARLQAQDEEPSIRSLIGGFLNSSSAWKGPETVKEEQENDEAFPGEDLEADELPETMNEGWKVQTFGLTLNRLESSSAVFGRRAKALSKNSAFTQEQIRQLLHAMDSAPLGDSLNKPNAAKADHMSESTLLFGESTDCVGSTICSDDSLRGGSLGASQGVWGKQFSKLKGGSKELGAVSKDSSQAAAATSAPPASGSSGAPASSSTSASKRAQRVFEALSVVTDTAAKPEGKAQVLLNAANNRFLNRARRDPAISKLSL